MKREYVQLITRKALLMLLLLPFMVSGCIKDNMDDCYKFPAILALAEATVGGTPVNLQDVQDVVLYIFDQDGKFLDRIVVSINERTELDYPDATNLTIVGFANVSETNELITQLTLDSYEQDGKITLKKLQDYLSQPIYNSPSDIFWGEIDILNDRKAGETTTLSVKRIVSGVNVKIRGIKEYVSATDEDFRIVVSTDYNAVNFEGDAERGGANYMPAGGTFSSQSPSQLDIPTFRILSTLQGSPVTVKIYYKNVLVDTVTKDSDGNPLIAYNGKLLEVRINYIGHVTVTIRTSEWDKESIWHTI